MRAIAPTSSTIYPSARRTGANFCANGIAIAMVPPFKVAFAAASRQRCCKHRPAGQSGVTFDSREVAADNTDD
ncbi:uncharacterized protein ColSpa_09809 [Colletotrichum spaethianum]|uniref:Uncharacterized protein n=1 Tax=Colletotrichum spaethianum TaxID=700344 RepID=A0AA37PC96_9PEZI|nr:uncharacterized protein ColSpa_09809 [Colletotrichum spaethianum]GKT49628.1 hypothetical protein ColSpa_09809 [Colletotrichum spaethianum]